MVMCRRPDCRDLFEAPPARPSVDLRKRPRRKSRSNWTLNRQRLAEIGKLIQLRHRGACDTDDGEAYLSAAIPALVELAGGFEAEGCESRIHEWARLGCGLDQHQKAMTAASARAEA
ncbi:hypothetical protein AEGHOMDF_4900 [Methylobacterium soli]|nr:hypothetical protein AEGHOMDF_4900 [Methylobacterium soli]